MGMAAAIVGAGALGVAGSVASGVIGANAADKAASTQAAASDTASANTLAMFNKTQANLAPFVGAGTNALTAMQGLTGTNLGGNPLTAPLTAPFNPTMASLAATPGYQFTLDQGLKSTQNGFAAQGLGTSGAAAKGAANYAEGLAGTTYQQQFQNYLTQNQQIYNLLGGQTSLGENAAATTGNQGLSATGQAGNFLTSGAAASAAGTIGAANSAINGLSGISSAGSNTAMMLALNNSGLFSSGASANSG